MKINIHLVGTSPILCHNPQMVDPEFALNRQIKMITSKKKKTDEDLKQIERLEWYGGLYTSNGDSGPPIVVQPTSKVRKCLIEAAKITKQGKAVERCLSIMELSVPLIYKGPKNIDELFKLPQFTSRLSVGIAQKRVMRVRPQFMPWELKLDALFIEDAGLNQDEFESIVESAGLTTGIGDGRSIGYGRFTGKVAWK
jgi:hypothetical protein